MTGLMKNHTLGILLNQVLTAITFLALMAGCTPSQEEKPLTIALSKSSPADSYRNYIRWIHSVDSTIKLVDMYSVPDDSVEIYLSSCSGILFTGGTDIAPGLYGKVADTSRCKTPDNRLDSLEYRLFRRATEKGIPVLGICRGIQVINTALGGSLIIDIPQDLGTGVIHQCDDYLHCYHQVRVTKGSLLDSISGTKQDSVTTNHHQGIDRLAEGLQVAAYSADGLPEAIQWEKPAGMPFMLAVQWHPERMIPESPLSRPILIRFIDEARKKNSKQL